MSDIVNRLNAPPVANHYYRPGDRIDGLVLTERREAAAEITRLRSLLPDGMDDCRIIFEQCEVGHGWLRGENWVKHDCPWCQIARLRAENERLKEQAAAPWVDGYETAKDEYRSRLIEAEEKIERLREALLAWEDAVRIDVTMEGPHFMGVERIRGERAWGLTAAILEGNSDE